MVVLKVLCCIVLYAIAGFIAMVARIMHGRKVRSVDEELDRKISDKYLRICGFNKRWFGQNYIVRRDRAIDKMPIWALYIFGIAAWPMDTIAYVYAVITTR